MQNSFTDLLKGCKRYDRKAQRLMVDRLAPFLMAICKRYEPTHEHARDAVQESLILIFNSIEDCIPEERPFWGWCKRIAINVCLAKIRKKRLDFLDLGDQVPDLPVSAEISERMDAEAVLALLDQLPENQRLVFNLYVIDGYAHAEIGEIMQIQESSSRTLLTRARTTLQAIIINQEFLNNAY